MEIYQSPQDRFVANFIGLTNFIDGRVKSSPCDTASIREVETACGDLSCVLDEGMKPGDPVIVVVRPEDIRVINDSKPRHNLFQGKVNAVIFMGDSLECQVLVGKPAPADETASFVPRATRSEYFIGIAGRMLPSAARAMNHQASYARKSPRHDRLAGLNVLRPAELGIIDFTQSFDFEFHSEIELRCDLDRLYGTGNVPR